MGHGVRIDNQLIKKALPWHLRLIGLFAAHGNDLPENEAGIPGNTMAA